MGHLIHDHLTYSEVCKLYKKAFNHFGRVALEHRRGNVAVSLAYAIEVVRLHQALHKKSRELSDTDTLIDLRIMHDELADLIALIVDHFELRHEDLVERAQSAASSFRRSLASSPRRSLASSPSRLASSPERQQLSRAAQLSRAYEEGPVAGRTRARARELESARLASQSRRDALASDVLEARSARESVAADRLSERSRLESEAASRLASRSRADSLAASRLSARSQSDLRASAGLDARSQFESAVSSRLAASPTRSLSPGSSVANDLFGTRVSAA